MGSSVRFAGAASLLLMTVSGCLFGDHGGGAGRQTDPSLTPSTEIVESGEAPPKPEAKEVAATPSVLPPTGTVAAPEPKTAPVSAGTRYVASSSLWVRKGPGAKYGTVRVLKRGDVVEVQEVKRIWAKIGSDEFVAEKYLTPKKPSL